MNSAQQDITHAAHNPGHNRRRPGAVFEYERPSTMDNVMFYAFAGAGTLNGGNAIKQQQICRFDTSKGSAARVRAEIRSFRALLRAS